MEEAVLPQVALPSDFHFTDEDFDWLRRVANQHSGIILGPSKRNMVYGRLASRLRKLQLTKFSEYRQVLQDRNGSEFPEFINALTTNLTAFFREPHHFRHLEEQVTTASMRDRSRRAPFRVWSAGCSTGEEPYTISMVLNSVLENQRHSATYEILATDLDTNVLRAAASGVYAATRVEGLDDPILCANFFRGVAESGGKVKVKPHIQQPIRFEQLNLVKQWMPMEPFDAIFCRNVIIYFDRTTKDRLFAGFAKVLKVGGFLYLGHSESLPHTHDRFAFVGRTTYQRVG